jgi:hypothetical protein
MKQGKRKTETTETQSPLSHIFSSRSMRRPMTYLPRLFLHTQTYTHTHTKRERERDVTGLDLYI